MKIYHQHRVSGASLAPASLLLLLLLCQVVIYEGRGKTPFDHRWGKVHRVGCVGEVHAH